MDDLSQKIDTLTKTLQLTNTLLEKLLEKTHDKTTKTSEKNVMYPNHGKPWTKEKDDELKTLFKGTTNETLNDKISEISQIVGRTKDSIKSRLILKHLIVYEDDKLIVPEDKYVMV